MKTALLIIDMQKFVTERIQNGVECYPHNSIENMESLMAQFRKTENPVIHVRHQSPDPDSDLHRSSQFSMPMENFEALPGEPVFIKSTSSAFSSTTLLSYLQANDIAEIVVIGAVAGFCVNSTVRAGADAGLRMTVVKDAVISFEVQEHRLRAKEILDVTLALLASDFARVVSSSGLHGD